MVVTFFLAVVMGPRLRGDDSGGCGNDGARRKQMVGNASLLAHLQQRLRVDEHEGDGAGGVGAIAPSVVGAALDQDVASFQQGLALIHQRINLAGEHDRVIDGIGLVKAGMTGIAAIGGIATAGAVVGPGQLGGERRQDARCRADIR